MIEGELGFMMEICPKKFRDQGINLWFDKIQTQTQLSHTFSLTLITLEKI